MATPHPGWSGFRYCRTRRPRVDETVELTLADPACATLGDPSGATLIITDDEPAAPGPDYAVTARSPASRVAAFVLRNNLVDETTPADGSFAFTERLAFRTGL